MKETLLPYDKEFIRLSISNLRTDRMKMFKTMLKRLEKCEYLEQKITLISDYTRKVSFLDKSIKTLLKEMKT
jgi:hypothetical protein